MKTNSEIKSFANTVINYALSFISKEQLLKNQILYNKINDIINKYAIGIVPVGWEIMIRQYLNYYNETFSDLIKECKEYHGDLYEIFDAVIEHNDKKMFAEFKEYIINNCNGDFIINNEDKDYYIKSIDKYISK